MSLGMKGCLKSLEGCNFRYKMHLLYWEIRYALQRAWNGYDSRDVWCLDRRLNERLIVLLKEYKKTYHCLWYCPEGYDWSKVCKKDIAKKYIFSEEQINAILDVLIFHLQMSNEDFVEKKLYGTNIYDNEYETGCRTSDDYMRIWNIRKQNQNAAIKLLGLLMDELWD